MKLHDRVIRAGFFNRAKFVLSFTRDERLFYEGLVLLADDSHCLLEDPWEFKLHIFPVDADITPDMLAAWTEKFVAAGKLVRYTAKGKECLYLANGPEHQKQGDMERPEVPTPAWVTWKPYPKNPYRGSYQFGEPSSIQAPPPADESIPSYASKEDVPQTEGEAGNGLSDPTLKTTSLDYDYDKTRTGEGCKGEPAVGHEADASAAPLASPGADAPPPPAQQAMPTEQAISPPDPQSDGRLTDPLALALDRLRRLPGYRAALDDLEWLQDRANLYPAADLLREVAKCADHWAPNDAKPNARKANWRSRITKWLDKGNAISTERLGHARDRPEGDDPVWSALRQRTNGAAEGGDPAW